MKGNTMKKTMILTTALVSMLAVSANAELKIAGSIETTYGSKEAPAVSGTPTSYDGNAIGQETKFEFNHTKDLVGGWTSKLDMEVMEVAGTVADTEITISNGDTSFFISKDGGSIHDNNVVPGAYNSQPADNASNSGVDLSKGTIHGVQNFGLAQKIDGFGKVELRYAPDHTASNTAGDKATGSGGGSGMEYGFSGNLGVDGLSVALSRAVDKNAVDTIDGDESTMFGVAYNFGQFAVGASQNQYDVSGTNNDEDHTLYGVTFAASDSLTLGVSYAELEYESSSITADEETTQFEAAYNLGGATVAFSYQQTENDGGTAGKDGDAYSITYKQSF
jgi:outer membrane protein OmpU